MSALLLSRRHFPSLAFRPVASAARPGFGFGPAAEIVRDGSDAVVKLDLPGVDIAKDVTVEVVDNALVVRGERRDERSDESAGRSYREVRYGSFRRSFALPANVSGDGVSASYDNGVLTVRVPGAYAGSEPVRVPVVTGTSPAATEQAEQTERAEQTEHAEQAEQTDQAAEAKNNG